MTVPKKSEDDTMISNEYTFERERVVRAYEQENELQKPEEVVLTMLKDRLKDMRMLDIGVGAGRTTFHFAPLVKEYIGVDYSHKMIEACKRRFPERADSFRVCDARSMSVLPHECCSASTASIMCLSRIARRFSMKLRAWLIMGLNFFFQHTI